MKRTILTILAILGALGLAIVFGLMSQRADRPDQTVPPTTKQTQPAEPDAPVPNVTAGVPTAPDTADTSEPADADQPQVAIGVLKVVEAAEPQPEPVIGDDTFSIEENPWAMKVVLSPWGASVRSIHLSRYSHEVLENDPYQIQSRVQIRTGERVSSRFPMAARTVEINGQVLPLATQRWQFEADQSTESRKVFSILIADGLTDEPVLRITRAYELEPGKRDASERFIEGRYDLLLHQHLTNLSGTALKVRFSQYGQTDTPDEKSYMGDWRKVVLGYFQPTYDPARKRVFIDDMQFSRKNVISDANRTPLWPTPVSDEKEYELVFVAMSNRYFTTALHNLTQTVKLEDGQTEVRAQTLEAKFPTVQTATLGTTDAGYLLTTLTSQTLTLESGQSADLSIALFAGPKAPDLFEGDPSYSAIGLDHLIIYNLGGCCAALTFEWLADFLIWFLKTIHAIVFDWGISIVILVLVVRLILHPITKKSQINMMKFGKQMQALQPEMERIKKKHKDNQQKLNQEIMKLYREKGVNPAAMGLGCLPMFLQMPIWIALYAMLFFAIELRHESAFYDVFHRMAAMFGGDWRFLTDLSAPDQFIRFAPINVFGLFVLDSLNILPILMAFVFYFQQKLMAQPTANMSDQAKQQQKMMKFMTLLFPVFLYKAPSGLTLYILASTAAGIVDSYFVRKHLKEQEEAGTLFEKKKPKEGGFMDRLHKAAEAKQKQIEAQRNQQGGQGKKRRKK